MLRIRLKVPDEVTLTPEIQKYLDEVEDIINKQCHVDFSDLALGRVITATEAKMDENHPAVIACRQITEVMMMPLADRTKEILEEK